MANDDGIKELDRDDPALQAPEPPETEHAQKKSEFVSTGEEVEASRIMDSSPTIIAQREKAARREAKNNG